MIQIKLYNNGFEILGHQNPITCGQVSILSWAYAQTIYKIDKTSEYYTSCNDEDFTKRNDGYTYMKFDTNNTFANWMFNEFKTNLKEWSDEMWKMEVIIEELDGEL